ncbi:hypothetical protein [Deinococcus sp.]|uniref:hypothetical protein n=1 Tax=Deinococcus sp. TaxID=47478 RepID=UPI002869B04B|nr:hypothetical protein [Deinococcus sp.]
MSAFKRAFAQATARYGRFGHAAHLYVVWTLLRESPTLNALAELRSGLRALAADLGVPEKYHETQTVAWTLLVLERLDKEEVWAAFETRNPDLFDAGLLGRYYPPDVLGRAGARAGFMVPLPSWERDEEGGVGTI